MSSGEPVREQARWPGLDGIRALAVVAVIAYHLGLPLSQGGFLGVDVFFVLSGFLITAVLLRERGRSGRISVPAFYVRRALRLFPALAVVVAFAVVVALVWPDEPVSRTTISGLPWVLLYVGNWVLAFGPHDALGGLYHTWSLSIEEQFYLIWPAIFILIMAKVRRRRHAVVLLIVIAALVATWRYVLIGLDSSGYRVTNGLDTHSDGLLLGCALAFLLATDGGSSGHHRAEPAGEGQQPRWHRGMSAVGWVAVLGLAFALTRMSSHASAASAYGYALAALLSAALVASVVIRPRALLSRLLAWRPAVWIGRRSYGLYLWHAPILLVPLPDRLPWLLQVVVKVAAVFVIAALSYQFVELPFLRMKKRFQRDRIPEPASTRPSGLGGDRGAGVLPDVAGELIA